MPEMGLAHRAVRGAALILASSYANLALGIGYGIVIARLFEPEHFGLVALGLFFCSLFDLRVKLGLDYAFIHRQPTTDELIGTHLLLQIGAALITLLITGGVAALVTLGGYPAALAPVIIALAGAQVIESAGATARVVLEKELVFSRTTAVITSALLFSYVAAIGMALQGWTYWALVGQVAVNVALGALGFWWTLKRAGRGIRLRFDRALSVCMLRFGAVMSLGALATILLLKFDNFLVGTFVGAAALGYYAQAYKVAQWPTGLVTHIVSRAALPTYAKLQDDLPRLAKAFGMTLWLILMLATPLALAIFVSAPDFLILLYGEKWLPSAILLRFLIIYSVLRPLLDDTGALFTAIGQPHRATIVLIVQALTLVIAATPFTLTFNAIGTAVGVGLAFVVGIALTYRFVARTIPVDLARLFIPTTLAAAISVALYLAFAHLVDLNALPLLARVLVKSSVAAGVFFGSALLLERGALIERVGYIWRLLRSSAA